MQSVTLPNTTILNDMYKRTGYVRQSSSFVVVMVGVAKNMSLRGGYKWRYYATLIPSLMKLMEFAE